MNDLIRRQEAIDIVAKEYQYESDRITALQKIPTVEATSVVHGEWINEYINRYGHPCHCCSVCGFHASHQDKNFCPECGADMRKKV